MQGNIRLSALDKRILNRLQDDIPFLKRPWEAIAKELRIDEDLLIARIASLKRAGVIRRISAVFSPRKIGHFSILTGVKAVPGGIGRVVDKINFYPEVTHNYRREGEYDIWFTIVAASNNRIKQILSRLKRDKDIEKISEFPARRLFKINVRFQI